jgi:hypothetical protein
MKKEVLTNGIAEAEAEASYEVTNIEIWNISEMLKRCANTGLDPDAFLKYIELSLLLEELTNKRNKAVTLLMNSYEIMKPELVDNLMVWPFQKHPKKDEILEKLSALNKQIVKLTPVNFILPEDFQVLTSKDSSGNPMSMGEIVALSKILMKR